MTRRLCLAALLAVTASISMARAGEQVRSCEIKARCTSGDASVTVADGVVTKLEVNVFFCGLKGRPGYTCTIDSSRSENDHAWSDDGGATVIANGTPFNATVPDRVKVTVGKYVSIDFAEAQSAGRCGAGAELPKAIVIPPQQGAACRVFLSAP
jgi:hypothetical protein